MGVIIGTGVTGHFDLSRPKNVKSAFGSVTVYEQAAERYVVIPRHGAEHKVPPHAINYRANIAALERLGTKEVIATSAVGSMNRGFVVGGLGLAEQFIDFTRRREVTFFGDEVRHTDMTNPYSRRVNEALASAAMKLGVKLRAGLVYVCTDGPRFETAAEIKMYRKLGGDVVGMTGVPEVVLAKEKGIDYSSVLVATNWAAGMQPAVSHEEVSKVMEGAGKLVKRLIEGAVRGLTGDER
ncbi:MAG: MTAP family purine nucleoside phosphorylase [Nitrososphaerota archaeon]|nr:MTAP family purine nucleoside phosphorylase [Nitrososphaerota archaeon]